ncbi:RDD family protein [Flavobacterium salmonis]|uniref:Transporter n=1 Tax=Flavobacterium salmonis TaxID=2654844 RepID=A0A6V6YTU5_9FLAO|nr:RDD family protein [Flavobacterium salmonis]CAD0002911.1 transporter [Flavobacterium salmonis]
MKKESFEISNYLLASKQKRFLNFIIDGVIKLIIVRLIITCLNLSQIAKQIDSLDMIERYMFWSLISFVYYGMTETFLSRSPAKYFTKTIVVMEDGSKPDVMNILTRTLLRIFPFEALSFLRGRALGLHDKNSGTLVVVKSKFEEQIKEHLELIALEKA